MRCSELSRTVDQNDEVRGVSWRHRKRLINAAFAMSRQTRHDDTFFDLRIKIYFCHVLKQLARKRMHREGKIKDFSNLCATAFFSKRMLEKKIPCYLWTLLSKKYFLCVK